MHLPNQIIIPEGLYVNAVGLEADTLVIHAQTISPTARCPVCSRPAHRVHGRYTRTLSDLPLANTPVRLLVTVRKFYCDNPLCARKVFAERLSGTAEALARRTSRQHQALLEIAFALGGEAGARLAGELGLPISPDTLLRYIRTAPDCIAHEVRLLGVDDWAWRRGQRYGTILVDLELRRIVDLLEDRSCGSFRSWLEAHPGMEMISRDRAEEYADGARTGAPEAIQVADRFHLVRNLSEALERVFRRHLSLIRRVPSPGCRALSPPRADKEAARDRTRKRREEQHKTIHQMARNGLSHRAIARATGLHRRTVRTYTEAECVPQLPRRSKSGVLTPYEGYILERWRQGCHNGTALWGEVAQMGYPGGRGNVSRLVAYLRKQESVGALPPGAVRGLTSRRAVGLILRPAQERTREQRSAINSLRQLHSELDGAITLFERFTEMVRSRGGDKLDGWLREAETSSIREMLRFVTKLRQDQDAVKNGLTLEWSQGQVEGQVTKLKMIRRQMYGRGNFDLVRKRALHKAA